MNNQVLIKIKFVGIDSWNRPVFKNVESKSHYGSANKLFSFDAKKEEVEKYFKDNISELEYFGNHFDCEPHGGLDESIKLEIVD